MELIQNFEIISLFNLLGAFILTSLVYFLRKNKTKLRREWCASLFDGPKTLPYFGNSLGFMLHPEDISHMLSFYTQKYGSRYRLWIGQKFSIVIADASDVENALMGNKFVNKGTDFHDLFGRAFKNGTFSVDGAHWKRGRKLLQRPFKTNILDNYTDVMNDESRKVVKELASKADTMEIFDICDYIAPAPFNIVCRSMYDLENLASNEDLTNFRECAGQFLGESVSSMFYPKLIRKIKEKIDENKIKKLINGVDIAYRLVMQEGKLNMNKDENEYNDESNDKFINCLFNDAFPHEDKKSEIITYSVGGSETLTVTLSLTFLMLAIHNDIQEKVYEELKLIFGDSDRDVTIDDVRQMDYLEQVLKEIMRMFPLVPFLFRTAKEDVTLGDYTLPADTEIIINVPALHKNPKYFPNPETFDPEHFSKEKCQELPKGCYLPFVIGPRNCIGKAFAMYEMKIICSMILRKYRVHTEMKQEDIKLKYSFVSGSAVGYKVSVSERNK